MEKYISEGQPIGSRVLSKDSALDLSPATIRNVMADLEDLGLIHSPHTSAGRVPTVSGYRLFIDSLLTVKPIRNQEIKEFRDGFALMSSVRSSTRGITQIVLLDIWVPMGRKNLFVLALWKILMLHSI